MRHSLKSLIKSVTAVLTASLVITGQLIFMPVQANADGFNPSIVNFVTSLYTDCLGRTPDATGLNDWCTRLSNHTITGKQCAYGFFFSKEFQNKANNISDVDMITAYYRVFLNRTPDEGGLNYWVGQIANTTNDLSVLFTGFADSAEFNTKCASYGITTGSHINVPITFTMHPAEVYNAMIAYQASYPEGTPFTNADVRPFHGGIYSRGAGCAGFAFMLSDAAFGNLPARIVYSMDSIRVGDIIRINNNSHSVIVLSVEPGGVVVAEGNYVGAVHWGRFISYDTLASSFTYVMTRYPASI